MELLAGSGAPVGGLDFVELSGAQQRAYDAACEAFQQAAAALGPQEEPIDPDAPVVEVSREKYLDCDGSGHGTLVITYSNGTTKEERF